MRAAVFNPIRPALDATRFCVIHAVRIGAGV